MKQKMHGDAKGFDFEAPTGAHAVVGLDYRLTKIGSHFTLGGNASIGGGYELGIPRNVDNKDIAFADPKKYRVIGWGVSAIYRVSFTYNKFVSVFVAASAHYLHTYSFDYTDNSTPTPSTGTMGSQNLVNVGLTAGVKFNIGNGRSVGHGMGKVGHVGRGH